MKRSVTQFFYFIERFLVVQLMDYLTKHKKNLYSLTEFIANQHGFSKSIFFGSSQLVK